MVMTQRSYHGININHIPCPSDRKRWYVWQVIKGPPCLVGRILRKVDINHGGWTNGEIHYRHIRTGQVLVRHDSTEVEYEC